VITVPVLQENISFDVKKPWTAHDDIRSLKSLILFGLKGMAEYAYHALALGLYGHRR
jgi:hydroxylamine reductase